MKVCGGLKLLRHEYGKVGEDNFYEGVRFELVRALSLICVTLGGFAVAQPPDLNAFKWQNRLILVFAPSPEHPLLRAQLERLEEYVASLEERDLMTLQVFAATGFVGDDKLDKAATEALREQFEVAAGEFAVLLVGKDGGVKRRSAEPIAAEALFAQIDSMPMRQREMREGD